MLKIIYKNKFKKDVERMKRRNKNMSELKWIIDQLVAKKPLPIKYCDHSLHGDYTDCRECHIQPDWLLIYMLNQEQITLIRTGSHSDLFK
jgi:mRNA interferase YafQ